ncbi:lytic transglycosylase domain-containing protein [Prosthecomicrobium sp. N25]|uniref:lytic transglycosylase domain-containing protein n=1 Tax=Prosthecomicrobium sp. N25 TaxID=3129254 RepID=UPI003076D40D
MGAQERGRPRGRAAGPASVGVLLAFVLAGVPSAPTAAQEEKDAPDAAPAGSGKASETVDEAICRLIESAAEVRKLPVPFFTRLIWRESSFRLNVVSRAGAQGVAQFMPGTARERGLADPFDPEAAIPASAALLADLRARFGNLGLAAAAYNAGPERVRQWLAGASGLPMETVTYVARITGLPAESWAEAARQGTALPDPAPEKCLVTLARFRKPGGEDYVAGGAVASVFAPWGVQIAGDFSRAKALAAFDRVRLRYAAVVGEVRPMIIGTRFRSRGTRPFYRIRLPAESRKAADDLCAKLRAAQGACIVLKS